MSKRIAILQSNYIPWKGYFDIINQVDEFIIYDEVQFTLSDWRSRNQIKTHTGLKWLSIPVKRNFKQLINETKVANNVWPKKHLRSIQQNYSKTEYFHMYSLLFESIYKESIKIEALSQINYLFIRAICDLLKIDTVITDSRDYKTSEIDKNMRLIELCKLSGATSYLSGPAGKGYLDMNLFKESGINVEYVSYDAYPQYYQMHGNFVHHVSVIDLLFNCGPNSKNFIQGASE
jgi:hypothetical protein